SVVRVSDGKYTIANLQVGKDCNDHSRLEMDGGQIILFQDPLDVGDATGSDAEVIIKAGSLHNCSDTYAGGGMGAAGHAGRGALIFQGGSFLARTLILGSGWGGQSLVAVEGSQPAAIHVLQYLYVNGLVGSDGMPGMATLSFTIDEHGVTPI